MATAAASTVEAVAEAPLPKAGSGEVPKRSGTFLDRAATNLTLARASTFPTDARDLRHAATMPLTYDVESDRPFCCGLWKMQQLLGAILGVAVFLVLVIVKPLDSEYARSNDMLGITLLMGLFWVFEVVPIYVTGLLPIVLIPACKITSTHEVAESYWNEVQMLFVSINLVDIALEEVGLPKRLAMKGLLAAGRLRPGYVLFILMSSCWLMSMFVNTIAVTLMITPFVIGLMNSVEERSPDTGSAEDPPSRETNSMEASETQGSVTTSAGKVQTIASALLLGVAFSSTAGGIATLTGSLPNRILAGQDMVMSEITWLSWFCYALPISLVTCVIAYGVIFFRYVRGISLPELKPQLVQDEYEEFLKENGPFSRDELLVGLVQVAQVVLLIVNPFFFRILENAEGSRLLSDATMAAVPALALFILPSSSRPGQSVLTWASVHEKLDFGMLLLIGGGFAIALGFKESGLQDDMGTWFAHSTHQLSGFPLALVVLLLGSLATQFLSSAACATVMLPVLASASLNAVVNPMQMLLPGTIACSLAFMLPTAAPGNIVALARSQELSQPLEARDFLFTGCPINFFSIILAAALGLGLGGAVFDANAPFPLDICAQADIGCEVVGLPGLVQGEHVDFQACRLLDSAIVDGKECKTCCQVWNRTILDARDLGVSGSFGLGQPQPEPEPQAA